MFEITNLAGGAVIGAGITWILERWVALFLKQLAVEHSSEFAQTTSANNSKFLRVWEFTRQCRLGLLFSASGGSGVLNF